MIMIFLIFIFYHSERINVGFDKWEIDIYIYIVIFDYL